MDKMLRATVLAGALMGCGPAGAVSYMESLIYTGPPEYGEVYDYSDSAPVAVSWSGTGRDLQAQAGWWSLGGALSASWDSSHQGWSYIFSDISKEFVVTAAGAASISFSWDGLLQVEGTSAFDNQYYQYAAANINDWTLGVNADASWYHEIDSVGSQSVSETTTFDYLFTEQDIGSTFEIILDFSSQTGLSNGNLSFTDGEVLDFLSSFNDSLRITGISGGITQANGDPLTSVPLPAAFWLFGSGLMGLLGFSKHRFIGGK
ncbi:MAG: hypothetical protein ABW101_00490 [Candidatus Thiodiazotropha sp.]